MPISKDEVGPIINFKGLTYAPINEQGVVLLFGMICEQLGIKVEAIRQAFPDAIAIDYRENPRRGVRKNIEFEYTSASFLRQKHDASECELLVCWEHDWKNPPDGLEIIELKSIIRNLKGEDRNAERELLKEPRKFKVRPGRSKVLSGWAIHKRTLQSSDAVKKRIEEAKTRGVSKKYIQFLERLRRYWEIREQSPPQKGKEPKTIFRLMRFKEYVKTPIESDWSIRILHPNEPIENCTILWNDTPLPWWDPEQLTYQRMIFASGGGNVRIPKGWENSNGRITVKDGEKRLVSKKFNELPTVPP